MLFLIMYVGAGSVLVLCTEHRLTCNYKTVNNAVRVFTFHHIVCLNTYKSKYL